jgi:hypothetical protein
MVADKIDANDRVDHFDGLGLPSRCADQITHDLRKWFDHEFGAAAAFWAWYRLAMPKVSGVP